jgi:hypothetical protein
MYGIPKKEMTTLITSLDAAVVHVRQDQSAGKDWISWEYYVTR